MYWIEFLISAAIIIFAGIQLTTFADKLSDQLRFGKVWVGIVLLGLVTSLPEALTSFVAIVQIQANDLAIGNLLGSNNFNPILIVVMDVIYRNGSVTNAITPNKSHKYSAVFAILLVLVVIVEISVGLKYAIFRLGPISLGNLCIILGYFGAMRFLSSVDMQNVETSSPVSPMTTNPQEMSLTKIGIGLGVSALLVVVGAIWLANSADQISAQTGLGRTFVGSIFLAFVTSLPEMVVSISALKLGSFDLAVGNIFGSNMTNIFILSISSLIYQENAILATVSETHILTAGLSIILTFIAAYGIYAKNKKTILGLGWDSIAMILFFIVGNGLLYQLR